MIKIAKFAPGNSLQLNIKNTISRLFSNQYRWYEITFHLFFVVLILISGIQYLERTLPFDSAFYCFKILQFGTFNVESGRWGAFYNELLPLAGIKMGCSLDTFLRLYSLSFALCNYVFFLIIFYGFRQLHTALAFILVQVVVYRYNFYCPASEIHAVTGPAFLMLALLNSELLERRKNIATSLILILIYWMANTHLVSVCIILFIFGYAFVNNTKLFRNVWLYIALITGLSVFFLLIKSISGGSYQDSKMVTSATLKYVVTHLNEVEGFKFLKTEFPKNYYIPVFILAGLLIFYLIKGKFIKMLLVIAAVVCFFILDMGYNIKYDSPFVMSNYYSIFGYFILIPFVFDVIRNIRFRYAFPITVIIIFISILKILKCGIFFTEQMDYYKRTTDNLRMYKERKFIVAENNIDWDKIWMKWDICFQSLIISSLQHPDSAITFFTPADMDIYKEKTCCDTNAFIGVDFSPFWFGAENFPKQYFNLRTGVYRKASSFQDSTFNPELFNKNNLTLDFPQNKFTMGMAANRTIPVKVHNYTQNNLPSVVTGQNHLLIGYEIIEKKSGTKVSEGRSVLEIDVPGGKTITSGLKLVLVTGDKVIKRGTYYIDADFVLEGKRWFGNKKRIELTVF